MPHSPCESFYPTCEETISTVPSTSTSSMVEMRRVSSMPERGIETVASGDPLLMASKSEGYPTSSSAARKKFQQLDTYGFISNMDRHGNFFTPEGDGAEEADNIIVRVHHNIPTYAQTVVLERRTEKWHAMLSAWERTLKRRPRLVLKRLRKGVPHQERGKVWAALGGIEAKMKAHPDLYDRLVRETAFGVSQNENGRTIGHSKSFKSIQETIERDIHRTFPRHSMFYDSDESDDEEPEEEGEQENSVVAAEPGLGGFACGGRITSMIRDLEFPDEAKTSLCASPHPQAMMHTSSVRTPQSIVNSKGGQASLRRVLKAYSLHDKEVGYCQGMNFIAGMFLTVMSEEEAFWMLSYIMNDKPCQMRGLFGEGMQETHKVLHVAEQLVHHFLPKLAKHLDREHVHVTMYATQWLLTQYTSSFKFDLVLRVWDCFLGEGWKITYRVMLSILQYFQSTLLQMSFEEILGFMRDIPEKLDGNVIVDAAIKIPLRRKHIAKYEHEWQAQQLQEKHKR